MLQAGLDSSRKKVVQGEKMFSAKSHALFVLPAMHGSRIAGLCLAQRPLMLAVVG